jgi:hypothetical protein
MQLSQYVVVLVHARIQNFDNLYKENPITQSKIQGQDPTYDYQNVNTNLGYRIDYDNGHEDLRSAKPSADSLFKLPYQYAPVPGKFDYFSEGRQPSQMNYAQNEIDFTSFGPESGSPQAALDFSDLYDDYDYKRAFGNQVETNYNPQFSREQENAQQNSKKHQKSLENVAKNELNAVSRLPNQILENYVQISDRNNQENKYTPDSISYENMLNDESANQEEVYFISPVQREYIPEPRLQEPIILDLDIEVPESMSFSKFTTTSQPVINAEKQVPDAKGLAEWNKILSDTSEDEMRIDSEDFGFNFGIPRIPDTPSGGHKELQNKPYLSKLLSTISNIVAVNDSESVNKTNKTLTTTLSESTSGFKEEKSTFLFYLTSTNSNVVTKSGGLNKTDVLSSTAQTETRVFNSSLGSITNSSNLSTLSTHPTQKSSNSSTMATTRAQEETNKLTGSSLLFNIEDLFDSNIDNLPSAIREDQHLKIRGVQHNSDSAAVDSETKSKKNENMKSKNNDDDFIKDSILNDKSKLRLILARNANSAPFFADEENDQRAAARRHSSLLSNKHVVSEEGK